MKTISQFRKFIHVRSLMGIMVALCLFFVVACDQKRLAKSDTVHKYHMQNKEKVYEEVDQMPEYPGGMTEMQKYLMSSVRYPIDAMNRNIQGKVFVRFCVTSKGTIDQISIFKGVDPALNAEAIRVVKTFPVFTPGKKEGVAVPVWYLVPITFKV